MNIDEFAPERTISDQGVDAFSVGADILRASFTPAPAGHVRQGRGLVLRPGDLLSARKSAVTQIFAHFVGAPSLKMIKARAHPGHFSVS